MTEQTADLSKRDLRHLMALCGEDARRQQREADRRDAAPRRRARAQAEAAESLRLRRRLSQIQRANR